MARYRLKLLEGEEEVVKPNPNPNPHPHPHPNPHLHPHPHPRPRPHPHQASEALEPHLFELSKHTFGNYAVSKLATLPPTHPALTRALRGNVVELLQHPQGSRVVQAAMTNPNPNPNPNPNSNPNLSFP